MIGDLSLIQILIITKNAPLGTRQKINLNAQSLIST